MGNQTYDPLDDPSYESNSLVAEDYPAPKLAPRAFELEVQKIIDAEGIGLHDYKSHHLEIIETADGEYEFDVTARFSALGVDFLALVECKAYKASVKRDEVQKLLTKLQSVGAQKGLLFSTSGFQSGAIKFAKAHGIALVQVADGRSRYFAKKFGRTALLYRAQAVACWLIDGASAAPIGDEDDEPRLRQQLFASSRPL